MKYRLIVGVGLCGFMGVVLPAHAFLGLEKLWGPPPATAHKTKIEQHVEGHKIRAIKLQKANAADLVEPLRTYLGIIKSEGSVVNNDAKNELIVTEFPANLERIEFLVHEMDRRYDNPNPRARQVLALEQLKVALRKLGPLTTESPGSAASGPSGASPQAAPRTPTYAGVPAPMYETHSASRPPSASSSEEVRKLQEDRPGVTELRLVGWVQDKHGPIVVLRDSKSRYIFHQGRVLYDSLDSHEAVPGLTGRIQNGFLMLRDENQRTMTLKLTSGDEAQERRP